MSIILTLFDEMAIHPPGYKLLKLKKAFYLKIQISTSLIINYSLILKN